MVVCDKVGGLAQFACSSHRLCCAPAEGCGTVLLDSSGELPTAGRNKAKNGLHKTLFVLFLSLPLPLSLSLSLCLSLSPTPSWQSLDPDSSTHPRKLFSRRPGRKMTRRMSAWAVQATAVLLPLSGELGLRFRACGFRVRKQWFRSPGQNGCGLRV